MFAARLSEAGGEALQVSDRQQALSAVEDMARELGWAALSCPPSVRWPAMDELWTDDPRRADFGLSEAEWGVAETGSVVLHHAGERGRSHSLLPPVVGFLLPASRLVRGVGDVLALIDDASDPLPACVTFVTGQSHSGDIAGVTCYGVHGPARVRVWVIDDA
jgi:L-lactate utilization protein LutC